MYIAHHIYRKLNQPEKPIFTIPTYLNNFTQMNNIIELCPMDRLLFIIV